MQKSNLATDARFWKVIDLDTGVDIAGVVWADDTTGEYFQSGKPLKCGNIKLIDIRDHYKKPLQNKSRCIQLGD